MTWENISAAEIATGEAVKSTTAEKIKNNLEFLQQRLTEIETGGNTVYPPIILRVNGTYGESGDLQLPALGILKTTLNFNLVITGVRLIIDKAGTSGTTEIDLKYKRGSGEYTSIFTTKPSVASAAGDDSISTNAVLNPEHVNLNAADFLRLDILSAQKRAVGLMVRIDFAKV